MSTAPSITIGRDPDGTPVDLDLEEVINSHMLVQGGTSSGKSYLFRRIAEQSFRHVQIIIVDPEDEFVSLREKFDFVLIGPGGETPADVRSVGVTMRKMLQLRASAVCNLYEMPIDERQEWLRLALEALDTAPKSLWHPLLVMVDEAAMFAPERGEGESVATNAVADLVTRGAKRGHGFIGAMHRLSTFKKSVAGLIRSGLIGATTMDVDQDRAAKRLGVRNQDKAVFFDELKNMQAGSFFAMGPAFRRRDRVLVKVGDIQTTHPKRGFQRQSYVKPPVPRRIKHLLPQLADLPQKAAEEAKTVAEFKAEIARLGRELSAAKALGASVLRQGAAKGGPGDVALRAEIERLGRELAAAKAAKAIPARERVVRVEVPFVPEAVLAAVEAASNASDGLVDALSVAGKTVRELSSQLKRANVVVRKPLPASAARREAMGGPAPTHGASAPVPAPIARDLGVPIEPGTYVIKNRKARLALQGHQGEPAPEARHDPSDTAIAEEMAHLPKGAMEMLRAIASSHVDSLTRRQVATLSGIKVTGGTFAKYKGLLVNGGYVTVNGPQMFLTEMGRATAGEVPKPMGGEALLAHWLAKLPGGAARMLEHVVRGVGPGNQIDKESWAIAANVSKTGGTFAKYCGILCTRGLVERLERGFFRASKLFEGAKPYGDQEAA